jgi:hypothetical protein
MNTAGKIALLTIGAAAIGGGIYLVTKQPATTAPGTPALPSGSVSSGTGNSLLDQGLSIFGKAQDASGKLTAKLYPAGTLLRGGTSEKIYQIDAQGAKHWISSRAKFDSLGLSMSNVKSIPEAELALIPNGSNISGLAGFAMGLR